MPRRVTCSQGRLTKSKPPKSSVLALLRGSRPNGGSVQPRWPRSASGASHHYTRGVGPPGLSSRCSPRSHCHLCPLPSNSPPSRIFRTHLFLRASRIRDRGLLLALAFPVPRLRHRLSCPRDLSCRRRRKIRTQGRRKPNPRQRRSHSQLPHLRPSHPRLHQRLSPPRCREGTANRQIPRHSRST